MTEDQKKETQTLVTEALEQCTKLRNQVEALSKRLLKALKALAE